MPEGVDAGGAAFYGRLEVRLRLALGVLELDVAFELRAPWSVLFAPSGAGKSTVLRMIAGLQRPEAGRVACIGGDEAQQKAAVLFDSPGGISIAPYRRGIGFVAQEPGLFPHMSVLRNVLFGTRSPERRRAAGEGAAPSVTEVLRLCRIEHLAAKMPFEISGGERQRVTLARAIAARPRRLLLLDEPFTGIDAELRDGLAADLRVWLERSGTPVLQVTHDLSDVLATGAEVLVMEGGRIVRQGSAEVVLARELERLRRQLTLRGALADAV